VARIALDIDSTLQHYWDLFGRVAEERFGVALPYRGQRDWAIAALGASCCRDPHRDAFRRERHGRAALRDEELVGEEGVIGGRTWSQLAPLVEAALAPA